MSTRPPWPTVEHVVMLGLSLTAQVIELIRAIHGG
jgi:hypothetical protein